MAVRISASGTDESKSYAATREVADETAGGGQGGSGDSGKGVSVDAGERRGRARRSRGGGLSLLASRLSESERGREGPAWRFVPAAVEGDVTGRVAVLRSGWRGGDCGML